MKNASKREKVVQTKEGKAVKGVVVEVVGVEDKVSKTRWLAA